MHACSSIMTPFPYKVKRKYQDRLIKDIETAFIRGENLLVSAPTGIGKTVCSLYPAVNFAHANSKKIFFLTSKTTQQQIVVDTLHMILGRDISFNAVKLKAKEKICINRVFYCHPLFCPFIKDYYIRLKKSSVVKEILSNQIITPEIIRRYALQHTLCPYEISLELLSSVHFIVCDYNYIFDPYISLNRLFASGAAKNFLLIVDEAHNLYSRGRDYYSPELTMDSIDVLLKALDDDTAECRRIGQIVLKIKDNINDHIKRHDVKNETEIEIDKDFFRRRFEEYSEEMPGYISYKKDRGNDLLDDPVKEFYYKLERFCNVLTYKGDEFQHLLKNGEAAKTLKILCLDPSVMIGEKIEQFYSTIAMSATMEPLRFYKDVLGFDSSRTKAVKYPSPFPVENRKILIIPHVSTKYREREKNYKEIARVIKNIISIRPGHYFAFFPSFKFINKVYPKIEESSQYEILIQDPAMNDIKRELFIQKLKNSSKNILLLAVLGGIFAEGVDYPGDMCIGVMAIGPGLPTYSKEQELIRDYYKKKYNKGFEYSYLYPGITRVIQSVGRVIRKETDHGIIALIDKRFSYPFYYSAFPAYWYEKSPRELVSKEYEKDIAGFWGNFEQADL